MMPRAPLQQAEGPRPTPALLISPASTGAWRGRGGVGWGGGARN